MMMTMTAGNSLQENPMRVMKIRIRQKKGKLKYKEGGSHMDKWSTLMSFLDNITNVMDTRKHPTMSPDPKLRGSTGGRNFFTSFIL